MTLKPVPTTGGSIQDAVAMTVKRTKPRVRVLWWIHVLDTSCMQLRRSIDIQLVLMKFIK